ncbi:IS5 family transposase [Xanthomonas oryzae pv. oryzicola]|uniref:IS5 family transposase n=3 Tax=Xanthomonas oryzae TaxID=347 RepID=UPI003DA16466
MQLTFGDAGDLGKRKQTRREIFLAEMEQVVPWQQLRVLIALHSPVSGRPGRQPYALATMWRIHLLQQWYALSDPAMEEVLHEIATLRRVAQLGGLDDIPDEPTILNVRRLLETRDLAARMLEAVNAHLARKGQSLRSGTIVDARLIAAPSSTKSAHHARETEMHQTRKRNQWYFGMKAHIGVDAFSGRAHHVHGTAADVTVAHTLLHGKEDRVFGDSGYTGAEKRDELRDCKAAFFIAARPSTIQAIGNNRERAREQRWEHVKASVRAKVEHPFRVIKRRFGYTKVRYRGLAKNTAHVLSLFALSTLWMKRKQSLHAMESVRL